MDMTDHPEFDTVSFSAPMTRAPDLSTEGLEALLAEAAESDGRYRPNLSQDLLSGRFQSGVSSLALADHLAGLSDLSLLNDHDPIESKVMSDIAHTLALCARLTRALIDTRKALEAEREKSAKFTVALREANEAKQTLRDALVSERERVAWQPIKTAPKDGEIILLARDHGPERDNETVAAYWGSSAWYGECWISPSSGLGAIITDPTHWRPLPEPPCQAKDQPHD